MSTSIIGTKFVLTKACPTYETKPGMFAVIAKYEKNVVKDRMEAVVAVFGDESLADKYASNLKALAADANALDADGPGCASCVAGPGSRWLSVCWAQPWVVGINTQGLASCLQRARCSTR